MKEQSTQTILDHVLSLLGEECGEVQQVLGKISRFGMYDINPQTNESNWLELRKEMHDLKAAWDLVCDELDRFSSLDERLISEKKKKVRKYMEYAIERGRLQPNH